MKKAYYLIPILIILSLFYFSHQPARKVTSQVDTSASQNNWQSIPLPKEVTDQLETGQPVSDYQTREAVKDLEGHLVSDSDKALFERYKQDGYVLSGQSIQVYSAKSDTYTQFIVLMQKKEKYVAILGNFYNQPREILLVATFDSINK